jgi:hypothetical protein
LHKSKEVASSLININEATIGELQQLEGIGPKRSTYIVDFRNSVDLIRNTFDLATATGLSIKAAERLSPGIDWKTDAMQPFGLWPAGLVTLASLWLVVSGFDQLAREQFFAPYSYYNLSLALILLGGLSATGELAVAMVRGRSNKSSRVSILAASLFTAGFVILMLLSISTVLVTYPVDFQNTLGRTIQFISYCALMFWLIYGPGFCFRFFIEDNHLEKLDSSKFLYDMSLTIAPLLPLYYLLIHNDPTWTTEIFSFWCAAIVTLGGLDLVRGRSAFVAILSAIDQSRFRFAYFGRGRREETNGTARVLGWICLGEAAILLGIAATRITLP